MCLSIQHVTALILVDQWTHSQLGNSRLDVIELGRAVAQQAVVVSMTLLGIK